MNTAKGFEVIQQKIRTNSVVNPCSTDICPSSFVSGIMSPVALAGVLAVAFTSMPVHAQWVTFSEQTSTRMPVGAGLNTAALSTTDPEEKDYAFGDVDKDGDLDLVCVRKQPFTSTGRRVNVLFMNEGIAQGHSINGVLVDRTSLYCTTTDVGGDLGFNTPTNDRDVILVDVNNDTWLDIVTATTLSDGQPKHIGHPRIYINRGNDGSNNWLGFRFENARIPEMHDTVQPRFCSVAGGDLTNDGYVDLYFGDYDSGGSETLDYNNKLLINSGASNPGFFSDSGTTRMSADPGLRSAFGAASVIIDMNGDGVLDVVKQTSLSAPTHIAVQHNNAPAGPDGIGFFPDLGYKTVNADAPYFVSAGDLNNDGRMDLVVTSDGADRFLLNTGNAANGTANFGTHTFSFLTGSDDGFGSQSVIADLNNDGWNDVLIADVDVDISGCGRRTHIYRNLGNAPTVTIQEQGTVLPTSKLTGTHNIAVFDLNGDGWLDLVMGRCSTTDVWINTPPSGLVFTYPQGLPAHIDPDQTAQFVVKLAVAGSGTVAPNTGKIFISQGGGPYVESPMSPLPNNEYLATLPAMDCPDQARFYVSGQLSGGGTFTDPPTAPTAYYIAVATLGTDITLRDEIEGDVSQWSIVNDASLTGGAWQPAVPNGTISSGFLAAPNQDATQGAANVKAFVTENGAAGNTTPGTWDVDGGPTQLISPMLNLAGTDASISFASWFFTGDIASGDKMTVAVSNNNGGSWTTVMDINSTNDGINTAWQTKSFVVGDYVTPSSQVRVRFSVADIGSPSVVEAGIDNFTVDEFICVETPSCPADLTNDQVVGVPDLLSMINAWGPCPAPCAADQNADNVIGVPDLLAIINAWGPCPQ